jgi:NADH:ubiquinone oxidoreductase subunit 6 (subunit J)
MRRYAVILINLLIVLSYSVLFMLINGPFGEQTFKHLYVLAAHVAILFVVGTFSLWKNERRGRMFLVSFVLVAVLGGGLWFLDAMGHMH